MKDEVLSCIGRGALVLGLSVLLLSHEAPHIDHTMSAVYTPATLWLDATGIERPAFRAEDPNS